MLVNADKPHLWKPDIAQSVDFYNSWFMQFAPSAYRDTRIATTISVESALARTANLTNITPPVLRQDPEVLPILRMATAPPIARDHLIGLAGMPPNLVKSMEEKQRIPPRMTSASLDAELTKIGQIIARLADKDIFSWLDTGQEPTDTQYLNNPEAQIKTIDHKLSQYFREGLKATGDSLEAVRFTASKWYSGRGSLKDNARPQFYNGAKYPSIKNYADSVKEKFEREKNR